MSQRGHYGMREMMTFDRSRPCLIIAPHLEYPTRNGADILVDMRWREFSNYVPFVDIVGKNIVVRYVAGVGEEIESFDNVWPSKLKAVGMTILKRGHYLFEKYLTSEFRKAAFRYLGEETYSTVVYSFITTASIGNCFLEKGGRLYCIETHNDEIAWFRNLRYSSGNPIAKLAAFFSERWLETFLRKHEKDFLYLHVCEADRSGYRRVMTDSNSLIAPVGVELSKAVVNFREIGSKNVLIFVGSLGLKMNFEALKTFGKEFFPVLSSVLGGDLEVVIAGSRPSRETRSLCTRYGWKLYPNVTDDRLRELYTSSTFSILPFHRITGVKLKLLKSFSLGVPVLATLEMRSQVDRQVEQCVFSNDPKEWLDKMLERRKKGISWESRQALVEYSKRYCWTNVVANLVSQLEKIGSEVGRESLGEYRQ